MFRSLRALAALLAVVGCASEETQGSLPPASSSTRPPALQPPDPAADPPAEVPVPVEPPAQPQQPGHEPQPAPESPQGEPPAQPEPQPPAQPEPQPPAQPQPTKQPAPATKPSTCIVDKESNTIVGLPLDELPPGFPTLTPRTLVWGGGHDQGEGHLVQVDGNRVLVLDQALGQLVEYEHSTDALKLVRTVPLGPSPRQLALGPGGEAYVVVEGLDLLVRVPKGAGSIDLAVPVGVRPTTLLVQPEGFTVHAVVGLAGTQEVVGLAPHVGKIQWRTPVYGTPRGLAAHGGHLVVTLQTGQPRGIALPKLADVTGLTPVVVPSKPLPLRTANPWHDYDAALGSTHPPWPSSHALAATVAPGGVLVAHSLAVVGSEDVVAMAKSLGVDPSLVLSAKKVAYYGLELADPCKTVPVRPLEVAVTRFDAGQPAPVEMGPAIRDPQSNRNLVAGFDQPAAIRHHPTRSLAFVVARGTDNVLLLNTMAADPMRWPLGQLRVGWGPADLAVRTDVEQYKPFVNSHAFVLSEHDRKVWRVPLAPLQGAVFDTFTSKPIPAPLVLDPDLSVPLPGQDPLSEQLRMGRRLFHFAANPKVSIAGRQACASCHPDGGQDGLPWATTLGMRQTALLAGRLQGTAPYGWFGEHETLADKLHQAVEHMGGTGLSVVENQALTAYLLSLPLPVKPLPPESAAWLEAVAQGKALFEDPEVACAKCHAGPKFTNGLAYDVGTATWSEKAWNGYTAPLFDTPSLLGVGSSAPYLHDGRAKTLQEVLSLTMDKMGKTSHLSPKQKDALVAYLLTL